MKKHITKLILFYATFSLIIACDVSDGQKPSLKVVNFSSSIEASSKNIVLTEINANESVINISWPAVVYPIKAPVVYTLQFDIPANTSGEKAWEKSIRVVAGEDVLSKSMIGLDLNKMARSLGLPINVSGKIAVRVESTMDRMIYSDPIVLNVTPYEKEVVFGEIYMPGSYQGWDINTAAALGAISKGVFQGYVTFPASQGLGFKFNTQRNWDQFYGADANGNLLDRSDIDFQISKAGSYQMTVNLNTLKWSAVPYAWGIIGTATTGNWDNSTEMSYDHQLKIWKFTGTLKPGALKFRLNNTWTINYGPKNSTDGIMYLDNQGAHDITEAGSYEVTFSVKEKDPTTSAYPATAIYTVKKI